MTHPTDIRTAILNDLGYFQRGEATRDEFADAVLQRFIESLEGLLEQQQLFDLGPTDTVAAVPVSAITDLISKFKGEE